MYTRISTEVLLVISLVMVAPILEYTPPFIQKQTKNQKQKNKPFLKKIRAPYFLEPKSKSQLQIKLATKNHQRAT
jgi:hypothetical protein